MPLTGRDTDIDKVYLPTKTSGAVAPVQLELRSHSYMDGSMVHLSIEQMIPLIRRVVLS